METIKHTYLHKHTYIHTYTYDLLFPNLVISGLADVVKALSDLQEDVCKVMHQ